MPATPPRPGAPREIVLVGFPDVELLDLTGPFEVLSTAARLAAPDDPPRVRMAAPSPEPFASRNGLELRAACTLDDVDAVDLLPRAARRAHGPRDDGDLVLSAGVSAGADAALHVVARIWGRPLAEQVAEHIEHVWQTS